MPEVQTSQTSGEMTQRFVAFILMQAQQISLCLGETPNPQEGKTLKNLEAARMLIDQLEMIREKTRGNLTSEESHILNQVLADFQLAYVKACSEETTSTPSGSPAPIPEEKPAPSAEEESKKRFSKSYG